MLKPIYPKNFRKQYKLMQKRGMAVDKLLEIMHMIINEQPLPPERSNHPLHGEWEGAFDCHIQGDWVLIYEIDSAAHTVTFHRTGSHSDLF
ncbi:MAG: type II toxin-antitoxin system YafQ family toxin [Treponema sp.]|jgi:mRNA interferase YafQ|nr:type II toxin-antitoxin system YafQ family toxin [Treponema sp.]